MASAILLLAIFLSTGPASSQDSLDVTFHAIDVVSTRLFVPGQFNDWGPNQDGRISVDAPTAMQSLDTPPGLWRYTHRLAVGERFEYKIHTHADEAGDQGTWSSDPLNPVVDQVSGFGNSVLDVTDPLLFQLGLLPDGERPGFGRALLATLTGSRPITELTYAINGGTPRNGLPDYNPRMSLLFVDLPSPIRLGSLIEVTATDAEGRHVELSAGEPQPAIVWETTSTSTLQPRVTVVASLSLPDGNIDPDLQTATLIVANESGSITTGIAVKEGRVQSEVELTPGENRILLSARLGQTDALSPPLILIRRLPRAELIQPRVEPATDFQIHIMLGAPDDVTMAWQIDEDLSTTTVRGMASSSQQITGVASGAGEVFVDLRIHDAAGRVDFHRLAVVVETDGTTHPLAPSRTAAWVERAILYEIFPLSFGDEAQGTRSAPGNRLRQITRHLDYIDRLGCNVIWLMPIFDDLFMDQVSGGYNIVDFFSVDEKLGQLEDARALVTRAHDLGMRVILDITPSHVSPRHPWVESVRHQGAESPFSGYLQTVPSPHDRGGDERGANLREIWHTEGADSLYRKYDGFGDLANLNWDDDGLQREMLDVLEFWLRDIGVDGYRLDVYWGPRRRYGRERFDEPMHQLMQRVRPDGLLLGEVSGTGTGTEAYYADTDADDRMSGALNAAYDWLFYHNGVRSQYGNLAAYDQRAHNNDYWPGPNARYLRFLENHDEERIAARFVDQPMRQLSLAGMLLTTTGMPMLYQGQEVGFGARVAGDPRRAPVLWDTPNNGRLAPTYQRLIHARRHFPAFWTQELVTLSRTDSVYVFVRPHPRQSAVVAINFAAGSRRVEVNPNAIVGDESTAYTRISTTPMVAPIRVVDAEGDGFEVELAPFETVIFLHGPEASLQTPDLTPLPYGASLRQGTSVMDVDDTTPSASLLLENFPNPFNASTTIRFSLPSTGPARMHLYDITGQRIRTLVDDIRVAGEHTIAVDVGSQASGVYLARLRQGTRTETRRMLLLK
jgi:glycosidase